MKEKKAHVVSFWMPDELKEELDRFQESYPDQSRSKYIVSAIREFLAEPRRRYLVEKPEPDYGRKLENYS
jgi:metal-responsive CopG/Arc/MetJ family transcriptional regulator